MEVFATPKINLIYTFSFGNVSLIIKNGYPSGKLFFFSFFNSSRQALNNLVFLNYNLYSFIISVFIITLLNKVSFIITLLVQMAAK